MKIIISPSKTKKLRKIKGIKNIKKPLFPKITDQIIKELSKFSKEKMEKKFKVKKEAAEKLISFYRNYEEKEAGHALASYSGIAYKSLNIKEFNEEDVKFSEGHLVILSALYGVLTPITCIKEYRLDMINSLFQDKSLYEIWKKDINCYFKEEKVIINLASKEYSKIIDPEKLYDFEFYIKENGKLRQISTNSKKMRGFTANYIIKNRITDVKSLRGITLDSYKYDSKLSNEKKYVYIQEK